MSAHLAYDERAFDAQQLLRIDIIRTMPEKARGLSADAIAILLDEVSNTPADFGHHTTSALRVARETTIELRDRLRDANESQRRRENIEFCEQHGIAWQTVPSLARFIEPMPASVTSSPRASKSDAVRQSPATTKKSRRAKTK